MNEVDGFVVITFTGVGPSWELTSDKGHVVYRITNCPNKDDALELARKWATSWYNYRIKDGTNAKEKK